MTEMLVVCSVFSALMFFLVIVLPGLNRQPIKRPRDQRSSQEPTVDSRNQAVA